MVFSNTLPTMTYCRSFLYELSFINYHRFQWDRNYLKRKKKQNRLLTLKCIYRCIIKFRKNKTHHRRYHCDLFIHQYSLISFCICNTNIKLNGHKRCSKSQEIPRDIQSGTRYESQLIRWTTRKTPKSEYNNSAIRNYSVFAVCLVFYCD